MVKGIVTEKEGLVRLTSELKQINKELKVRGEQQEAISEIGMYALAGGDLVELMKKQQFALPGFLMWSFAKC